MDPQAFIIAVLFMLTLGITLAGMLAYANHKFYFAEDPRIDNIEALLPGTNCGACGQPGCHAFSEALVAGQENPARCTVGSAESKLKIAAQLGIELAYAELRVARLACAGGNHVAYQRTRYVGMESCRAAALVAGGGKGCSWGCLGLEDCGRVCDFGAITFSEHGLPIVSAEKCTACGDCVEICPKDLFSIHPLSHHLWVNCKSLEKGDAALAECEVACTACGKCAADAGSGVVTMQGNLPVVNYQLNDFSNRHIIDRCPTGAIVWINEKDEFETGKAARPVIRSKALPIG